MSTQVQYRRGSATENNAFTGALAEITVDTTNWTLRVHDGVTAGGGGNVATVAYVTAQLAALSANSISFGTSNVQIPSSGSDIRVNVGGTSNVVVFTTAGLTLTGDITNGGSNATGNIGSSSTYFNTVFAKATSAQYADVAEKYIADLAYPPGTVLDFGGEKEVTVSTTNHSTTIAGVVSTNPAYIMNAGAKGETIVDVALLGRVPCNVVGQIKKGDRLVSSNTPGVAQALDISKYQPGSIIGKALEDYNSDDVGQIEVVVGRV